MASASLVPPETGRRSKDKPSSEGSSGAGGNGISVTTRSWPVALWAKLGLDMNKVSLMFKGACPPVIALALYQASPVAEIFSTLGYLVAIMSILSFAIMPRAKFFQTMTFNVLGVCIGAAVALLTIYCGVQARIHTTPVSTLSSGGPAPGAAVASYNSSASAVCAIWLFANICFANALRFSRPQLQFPVIIYSIFANVASTYAPQFATMAQGISFVKRLMEAFLAGFGIAAGVNLVVIPKSSRDVVFAEAKDYIKALQEVLKAQNIYLQTLEQKEMFLPSDQLDPKSESPEAVSAKGLKSAVAGLTALHGKLNADLVFAKREVAYSHLNQKDIDQLFQLFREILLPMIGMGSVVDIFNRIAEARGWRDADDAKQSDEATSKSADKERKEREKQEWNEVMKALHAPFESMSVAMNDGLQHVMYALKLARQPRPNQRESDGDVETGIKDTRPGDKHFGSTLSTKLKLFYEQREVTLKTWCDLRGINMDHIAETVSSSAVDKDRSARNDRQLYLILYMEFLLWSTGVAVLELVRFADAKVEAGVMIKRRLILPGKKRLHKWIMSSLNPQDGSSDLAPDHAEAGMSTVNLGDSYRQRKDPEHLPPTNAWQRFGNKVRAVSDVMSSAEMGFGFRVACGTMSIGIVAFLENTQTFFIEQRLVWAMIMVAIGMTMTAGSGTFGLLGRVFGTFLATCTSLIIWYIAGGRGVPGGVLPLLFVLLFLQIYFLLSYPRFTVVVMITMVTEVLILGYELEVNKVGVATATSNGQPYYEIYLLAPYRLVTVAGGCFVAFIWTFFPYPITARSTLRKQLGESLYLLANYYSCVHTTVGMRLRGDGGDIKDKTSPGRRLDKAREHILGIELSLFEQMRQHSASTAFEPTFGGKFPKERYDTIIDVVQNILNYMALVSYATRWYGKETATPAEGKWVRDLGQVIGSVHVTSQHITSLLTLLSASIIDGSSLPPYLQAPMSYQLSMRLKEIDSDILSVNHIAEPGYAAFAVTQVASSLINNDLEKLLSNVKALVGEVDFAFHIIRSEEPSNASLPLDQEKGKRD